MLQRYSSACSNVLCRPSQVCSLDGSAQKMLEMSITPHGLMRRLSALALSQGMRGRGVVILWRC